MSLDRPKNTTDRDTTTENPIVHHPRPRHLLRGAILSYCGAPWDFSYDVLTWHEFVALGPAGQCPGCRRCYLCLADMLPYKPCPATPQPHSASVPSDRSPARNQRTPERSTAGHTSTAPRSTGKEPSGSVQALRVYFAQAPTR